MLPSRLTRWKQATGVALGEHRAVAITMASFPGAPAEVAADEIAIGEGGISAALAALAEKGALRPPVAVGLDARSVFFVAKPRTGAGEIDAAALLDVHFAAARPAGGVVGDAAAVSTRGGAYTILAACRRVLAEQVHEGLAKIPCTQRTLEPAPYALLRAAVAADAAPRNWRTTVRILVDGTRGLAVLSRGRVPLAWRPMSLTSARVLDEVVGALRGLAAHARADLGISQIDGAILHGDPSLADVVAKAGAVCTVPLRLASAVRTDERSVATNLAIGAIQQGVFTPNLLNDLRPPLSLRQIFPWGTAAAMSAAVVASWQSLAFEAASYERRESKAQARIDAALKGAKVRASDLKQAHASALHEAELMNRFVGNRVPWAQILRELPEHVPEETVLTGLSGRDQLVLPSVDKKTDKVIASRDVAFQGQLRVEKDDASPDEIADLLAGMNAFPTLVASFPRIDGAEVTRRPGREGDSASFVIRCGLKR